MMKHFSLALLSLTTWILTAQAGYFWCFCNRSSVTREVCNSFPNAFLNGDHGEEICILSDSDDERKAFSMACRRHPRGEHGLCSWDENDRPRPRPRPTATATVNTHSG
ncbi:hypothetical protein LX36DRAFT_656762 [Colletotrichum falcatum]|nr:hypothetical protein LX36DRAFT_656762 [Colletotrichum falcatum]